MNVKTASGDVYVISPDIILLYGDAGIELRLNQRNLQTLERVRNSLECVKDADVKGRRFTVAYNGQLDDYRFDLDSGTQVRSPAWQFQIESAEEPV